MPYVNDWMAINVLNNNITELDLIAKDINADNTELKDRDYYKDLQPIKDRFTLEDGTFDNDAYNKVYDSVLYSYNNFLQEDYEKNLIKQIPKSPNYWMDLSAPTWNTEVEIGPNDDPYHHSRGLAGITTIGDPKWSAREIAQTQNLYDKNGNELNYSPNDVSIFKAFSQPTYAIAQYTEAGTHMENGVEVEHEAGEFKKNKRGEFYYQEVNPSEDVYNKEVLRVSDCITRDGSWANQYLDIFDSDSVDQSVARTTVKTVAAFVPYLIPGVKQAFGIVGALEQIALATPTIAKAVDSFFTGTDDNTFGKKMKTWENYMNRFAHTGTDYGRQHFWSWENIGSQIVQSGAQLYQQKFIQKAPFVIQQLLGGTPSKSTKQLARGLSLGYMAATSGMYTYGDFKQAGASDWAAGLGTLLTIGAFYGLMNSEYYKNFIFGETSFLNDDYVSRNTIKNIGNQFKTMLEAESGQQWSEISGNVSREMAQGWIRKGYELFKKGIKKGLNKISKPAKATTDEVVNQVSQEGASAVQKVTQNAGVSWFNIFLNRSSNEMVEEVMEEATSDIVKGITLVGESLGWDVREKSDQKLDFGFTADNILQRYLTAGIGGFLGGAVFAGLDQFDFMCGPQIRRVTDKNISDNKRFAYILKEEGLESVVNTINNMRKRHIFAPKGLGVKPLTYKGLDDKETTIYEPSKENANQNDIIADMMIDYANYIYKVMYIYDLKRKNGELFDIIKASVNQAEEESKPYQDKLAKVMKKEGLTLAQAYEKYAYQDAVVNALEQAHLFDDFYDEYISLGNDIVSIQSNLDILQQQMRQDKDMTTDAFNDAWKNSDVRKRWDDRLKDLLKKRDNILYGDRARYYVSRAAYLAFDDITNMMINVTTDDNDARTESENAYLKNIRQYVSSKYNIDYNTLSEKEQLFYKTEFDKYKSGEELTKKKQAFDIYYNLSKYATDNNTLKEFIEESKVPVQLNKENIEREILSCNNAINALTEQKRTLAKPGVKVEIPEEVDITPEQRDELTEFIYSLGIGTDILHFIHDTSDGAVYGSVSEDQYGRPGSIQINLAKCKDYKTLSETLLHELIGHYGLRILINSINTRQIFLGKTPFLATIQEKVKANRQATLTPEKLSKIEEDAKSDSAFDIFLDYIYELGDESIQNAIKEKISSAGADIEDIKARRYWTEEYIAETAETKPELLKSSTKSWFARIIDVLKKIFGLPTEDKVNEADIVSFLDATKLFLTQNQVSKDHINASEDISNQETDINKDKALRNNNFAATTAEYDAKIAEINRNINYLTQLRDSNMTTLNYIDTIVNAEEAKLIKSIQFNKDTSIEEHDTLEQLNEDLIVVPTLADASPKVKRMALNIISGRLLNIFNYYKRDLSNPNEFNDWFDNIYSSFTNLIDPDNRQKIIEEIGIWQDGGNYTGFQATNKRIWDTINTTINTISTESQKTENKDLDAWSDARNEYISIIEKELNKLKTVSGLNIEDAKDKLTSFKEAPSQETFNNLTSAIQSLQIQPVGDNGIVQKLEAVLNAINIIVGEQATLQDIDSPLNNLFNLMNAINIDSDTTLLKLGTLLQQEFSKDKISLNVEKFVLENDTRKALTNFTELVQIARALVLGSVDSPRTYGLNWLINLINSNKDLYTNATSRVAELTDVYASHFELLFNRLNYLSRLNNNASGAQLRTQKKIGAINHYRLYKQLANPILNKWKTEDGKTIADLLFENDINLTDNELNPNEYPEWFSKIMNFEKQFWNEHQDMDPEIKSLFDNSNTHNTYPGMFASNNTEEGLQNITAKLYMLALLSTDSNEFYKDYAKICQEENQNVPFFTQFLNIRLAWAYAKNPTVFNNFIQDLSINDQLKVKNIFAVLGSSGTGKTTIVAKFLYKMLDKNNVLLAAPVQDQLDVLTEALDPEADTIDINQIINSIVGSNMQEFINTNTEFLEKIGVRVIKPDVTITIPKDSSKAGKTIILDEVTLLAPFKLQLLTKWAEENNVNIIALGDPKQNADFEVKSGKGGELLTSSFLDLKMCTGPILSSSIRSTYIANYNNILRLNTILDKMTREVMKGENITSWETYLNYYIEGDKIETFVGAKTESWDSNTVIEKIKELQSKLPDAKIIVVTDHRNDYNSISGDSNIAIHSVQSVQGREADFCFVDVKDNSSIEGRLQSTNIFYTLATRARQGTIFIKHSSNVWDEYITDFMLDESGNLKHDATTEQYDQYKREYLTKYLNQEISEANEEESDDAETGINMHHRRDTLQHIITDSSFKVDEEALTNDEIDAIANNIVSLKNISNIYYKVKNDDNTIDYYFQLDVGLEKKLLFKVNTHNHDIYTNLIDAESGGSVVINSAILAQVKAVLDTFLTDNELKDFDIKEISKDELLETSIDKNFWKNNEENFVDYQLFSIFDISDSLNATATWRNDKKIKTLERIREVYLSRKNYSNVTNGNENYRILTTFSKDPKIKALLGQNRLDNDQLLDILNTISYLVFNQVTTTNELQSIDPTILTEVEKNKLFNKLMGYGLTEELVTNIFKAIIDNKQPIVKVDENKVIWIKIPHQDSAIYLPIGVCTPDSNFKIGVDQVLKSSTKVLSSVNITTFGNRRKSIDYFTKKGFKFTQPVIFAAKENAHYKKLVEKAKNEALSKAELEFVEWCNRNSGKLFYLYSDTPYLELDPSQIFTVQNVASSDSIYWYNERYGYLVGAQPSVSFSNLYTLSILEKYAASGNSQLKDILETILGKEDFTQQKAINYLAQMFNANELRSEIKLVDKTTKNKSEIQRANNIALYKYCPIVNSHTRENLYSCILSEILKDPNFKDRFIANLSEWILSFKGKYQKGIQFKFDDNVYELVAEPKKFRTSYKFAFKIYKVNESGSSQQDKIANYEEIPGFEKSFTLDTLFENLNKFLHSIKGDPEDKFSNDVLSKAIENFDITFCPVTSKIISDSPYQTRANMPIDIISFFSCITKGLTQEFTLAGSTRPHGDNANDIFTMLNSIEEKMKNKRNIPKNPFKWGIYLETKAPTANFIAGDNKEGAWKSANKYGNFATHTIDIQSIYRPIWNIELSNPGNITSEKIDPNIFHGNELLAKELLAKQPDISLQKLVEQINANIQATAGRQVTIDHYDIEDEKPILKTIINKSICEEYDEKTSTNVVITKNDVRFSNGNTIYRYYIDKGDVKHVVIDCDITYFVNTWGEDGVDYNANFISQLCKNEGDYNNTEIYQKIRKLSDKTQFRNLYNDIRNRLNCK